MSVRRHGRPAIPWLSRVATIVETCAARASGSSYQELGGRRTVEIERRDGGGDDPCRGSLPRGEERRIARLRRARLCGIRSGYIGNGPIRPCNMRSDPT